MAIVLNVVVTNIKAKNTALYNHWMPTSVLQFLHSKFDAITPARGIVLSWQFGQSLFK